MMDSDIEAEEVKTRWSIRPCNKGYSPAASRRMILDFFGNHFFRSVDLVEPRFHGFKHYGGRPQKIRGMPVLCSSFPVHLYGDQEELLPSLDVFPVTTPELVEEDWPDIDKAFEMIRREWTEFIALPDTARLKWRVLLFTVVRPELLFMRLAVNVR